MIAVRSGSPRRFWMTNNGWTILLVPICYYHFWIGFFIGFFISSFGCMSSISILSVSETASLPFMLPLSFAPVRSSGHTTPSPTDRGWVRSMNSFPLHEERIFDSTESDTIVNNQWNKIHVFVGSLVNNKTNYIDQMVVASMIPKDYFYSTKWFSQVQQDYLVYHLLKQKEHGYFLDLAANDAIRISNTFALEFYHQWDGIVIEPNAIYWSALAYRSCTVVAAVVGQRTGQEMTFKFPKHKPAPQGGLVGPNFDNVEPPPQTNGKKYDDNDENQNRVTVTLLDILKRYRAPSVIDYFSLDIEGAETFVMESFPFNQYRFNVLTVERADQRLRALLEENGYVHMKQLKKWGETLWMHSSIIHDSSVVDLSVLSLDTENYKYREQISSS